MRPWTRPTIPEPPSQTHLIITTTGHRAGSRGLSLQPIRGGFAPGTPDLHLHQPKKVAEACVSDPSRVSLAPLNTRQIEGAADTDEHRHIREHTLLGENTGVGLEP
ncbi:hypothetical protein DNTS_006454 [Danionella cerebrum]|uniref:Uncharacterized protein n=1 Tax=Danionella cerebrum TaxID=2873325 RepID=A0A553N410_9TELE|nr:hypothetical protein DNTS_006454 [Danionella translucida]